MQGKIKCSSLRFSSFFPAFLLFILLYENSQSNILKSNEHIAREILQNKKEPFKHNIPIQRFELCFENLKKKRKISNFTSNV